MNAGTTAVGTIISVRRYPVKSMQEEEINAAEVSDQRVVPCAHSLFSRSNVLDEGNKPFHFLETDLHVKGMTHCIVQ
jgi:hypothetical protein